MMARASAMLAALLLLQQGSSAPDDRDVQPFSELDLCIPFNVRIEHPPNGEDYRVIIDGDDSVKQAIQTIWNENSTYFSTLPYDMPGVLYVTAANASFQSQAPVSVTIQVPPKVLQVIDVTMGTQVSFASGFQWTESLGVWNVPGGATLLAPNVSINGPLTLTAANSALDNPFGRGGRIVWTNGRADQEALQAMSLEGPVNAVINSSTAIPGMQSFSLQPDVTAPSDLSTSYANVTLVVDPAQIGLMPQANLRDTYYPNRTCYNSASCYVRVITGAYPYSETASSDNIAFSESDYIPYEEVATPVAWTDCAQGITDFQCLSDATNQTCSASA